jgi:pimeloyl-ACP methyl ester carboxylesterase
LPHHIQTFRLEDGRGPHLEWLYRGKDKAKTSRAQVNRSVNKTVSILMVHGAYTNAWSWAESFMPYFCAQGYDCHAVSLRAHGQSRGKSQLDSSGLEEYALDVQRVIDEIEGPLVLMASSMGGLICQRLIAKGLRPAATIFISSVPPSGMTTSIIGMAFSNPRGFAELLQLALSGKPNQKFMQLIAHDPARRRDSGFYLDEVQRESVRAITDMTWLPMPLGVPKNHAIPVLVCHGREDQMVPVATAHEMSMAWSGDLSIFDNIGHIPMVERDWLRVATKIKLWLDGALQI